MVNNGKYTIYIYIYHTCMEHVGIAISFLTNSSRTNCPAKVRSAQLENARQSLKVPAELYHVTMGISKIPLWRLSLWHAKYSHFGHFPSQNQKAKLRMTTLAVTLGDQPCDALVPLHLFGTFQWCCCYETRMNHSCLACQGSVGDGENAPALVFPIVPV